MTDTPTAVALGALPTKSLAVTPGEVWRRREDTEPTPPGSGLWDCLSSVLRPKDSLSLAIVGARVVDRPDIDVIADAKNRAAQEALSSAAELRHGTDLTPTTRGVIAPLRMYRYLADLDATWSAHLRARAKQAGAGSGQREHQRSRSTPLIGRLARDGCGPGARLAPHRERQGRCTMQRPVLDCVPDQALRVSNSRRERKRSWSNTVSVRRSTGSIRDNIAFFAMAKNLKDGPSFRVWIAKLWEFDFGLTVKYMRRHATDFNEESIAYFNEMLTINGKERFLL